MAAGGKAINLGELAIAIALKTGALEAGLKEVQNKLKDHGKKVQATGADYDKLAIVAGVAFWKISSAIGSGVKAFNDFNNSMVGLKSVVQGTGGSFLEAQGFINDYVKDGLIPASDAATALKNLLSRGFGMGEASTILTRFKDSAAFGRQASLSLGEAIRGATEGLKNENSILVDNAGVTKNVSVMWKEYAQSIGKGVDSLTIAEKRQAELTGIMKETRFQIGDAAKYSEQFAGAQAKAAAETVKLNQAFGAALVPTLNELLSIGTPVISMFTKFVQSNPEVVAAVALSATAFLGLLTAFTAISAGAKILSPAIKELGVALTFLEAHPVILALSAIAIAFGAIYIQVKQSRKAQEDYNKALTEHNRIVKDGITKSEIPSLQEKVNKLKELSNQYDEVNAKLKAAKDFANSFQGVTRDIFSLGILPSPTDDVVKYNEQLEKIKSQLKVLGATQETTNKIINEYEAAIKSASRVTSTEYNEQARSISQKRIAVVETQNLIKAYKSAETGSKDWYAAQQKLAEQFPQFSTASGIEIKAIEAITTAQDAAVKAEWNMTKAKIAMTKIDLQNIITTKLAALESIEAQQKLFDNFNEITTGKKTERPMFAETPVTRAKREIVSLKEEMRTLDAFADLDIDKILGVKPYSGDPYEAYSNEALDAALKIHNHKVKMSEITKEAEIKDLESILREYVKTSDERMDLEERIYDAKQALRDKNQTAVEKSIQDEEAELERRTKFSFNWIDAQKQTSTFSAEDEIAAYNRMIAYHKEYLAKIVSDTKTSQEDKKRIQGQEVDTIKELEGKIFDMRKDYVEKAVSQYIQAQKEKYDTEEALENERLNKKLADLDKEYAAKERVMREGERENELGSLYEQERRFRNAATKQGQDHLKDIRNQISELEKESEKERLDAEKESKKESIEDEIKANQVKYAQLKTDLEKSGQEMLLTAEAYAHQMGSELGKAQSTVSDVLLNIMQDFDVKSTDLISQGMEKLKALIENYKRIMESITIQPKLQVAGMPGMTTQGSTSAKNGSSIIINDYGTKNLYGAEDVQDYGSELVTGAENASRG
jgi:hypothetical protein